MRLAVICHLAAKGILTPADGPYRAADMIESVTVMESKKVNG